MSELCAVFSLLQERSAESFSPHETTHKSRGLQVTPAGDQATALNENPEQRGISPLLTSRRGAYT